jgi:hypothetical protein
MARTILAATTAFLAASTLIANPARACISCEYTPEVVRESVTSRPAAKSYVSARAVAFKRRAPKTRIAVPSRPAARRVEVARAVPSQAKAKPQTAAITTGSVAKADTPSKPSGQQTNGAAAATPASAPASTSTVLMSQATRTAEAAPATKQVGCKKFLPAVGVTVDCK